MDFSNKTQRNNHLIWSLQENGEIGYVCFNFLDHMMYHGYTIVLNILTENRVWGSYPRKILTELVQNLTI